MNREELKIFLDLFLTKYYKELNEEESRLIMLFVLGICNDRFSRIVKEHNRQDNLLDLYDIRYIVIKNIIYILEGNDNINICSNDIILGGINALKGNVFKILRKDKIIMIPIFKPHINKNRNFIINENRRNFYIKIDYFNEESLEQMKLANIGNKTIIVDLRNNMGGKIKYANKFLELFILTEEPIYFLRDIKGMKYAVYLKNKQAKYHTNRLILFINKNTTSSAELVASALKKFNQTNIVGSISKGKGLMQKTFNLSKSTQILLPTFEFYIDDKINNKGVKPDFFINDKVIDRWICTNEKQ